MASSTCRALHTSQQLRFHRPKPSYPIEPWQPPALAHAEMARLKSSTESLPSCRTRVSNFKASCVLRLIFWLFFATGAGESVPNFQETMHIDTVCAPNQRIQRFCSMVGKAPTSPLKAWVLSLEVWGMWCYQPPPQAGWGSLQFLQLGGLPLKPYGKPQTLATWPFHQLPRFWLLSGSPTLEIRLHGSVSLGCETWALNSTAQ